jgi:hypothetical protein
LPEQPTDIKAPRNVAGIGFGPSDSGLAFDTAAKLSTPYWTVTAVENPRTKKWYLQPIDNSKQVADLKNQAERLCFEADKELSVFKSNISEEKEQKVRSLIEKVKGLVENDDSNLLTTAIEELKSEMKDMVTSPDPLVTDASGSNSMSDLNDL